MALSPICFSWVLKSRWVDCRVIQITFWEGRADWLLNNDWEQYGAFPSWPIKISKSDGDWHAHLGQPDPSLTHRRPHLNWCFQPGTLVCWVFLTVFYLIEGGFECSRAYCESTFNLRCVRAICTIYTQIYYSTFFHFMWGNFYAGMVFFFVCFLISIEEAFFIEKKHQKFESPGEYILHFWFLLLVFLWLGTGSQASSQSADVWGPSTTTHLSFLKQCNWRKIFSCNRLYCTSW